MLTRGASSDGRAFFFFLLFYGFRTPPPPVFYSVLKHVKKLTATHGLKGSTLIKFHTGIWSTYDTNILFSPVLTLIWKNVIKSVEPLIGSMYSPWSGEFTPYMFHKLAWCFFSRDKVTFLHPLTFQSKTQTQLPQTQLSLDPQSSCILGSLWARGWKSGRCHPFCEPGRKLLLASGMIMDRKDFGASRPEAAVTITVAGVDDQYV